MPAKPKHLHIDVHGAPGSGKSTFLRRLSAHARLLGIEILSTHDGEEEGRPAGHPAGLIIRLLQEPAPLAEGERFAVHTADDQVLALPPDETVHDAIDYLNDLLREAAEHPEGADDLAHAHLVKVRVEILESFPRADPYAAAPVAGRA